MENADNREKLPLADFPDAWQLERGTGDQRMVSVLFLSSSAGS